MFIHEALVGVKGLMKARPVRSGSKIQHRLVF
jgi:hypothetical protein